MMKNPSGPRRTGSPGAGVRASITQTLPPWSHGFNRIAATLVGVGLLVSRSVERRDWPVLQGAFLLLTISVVLCNYVADLLYFRFDPRITT